MQTLSSLLARRAPILLTIPNLDSILDLRSISALISTTRPVILLTLDNPYIVFDDGDIEITAPCPYIVRDYMGNTIHVGKDWGFGLNNTDRALLASVVPNSIEPFHIEYEYNNNPRSILVLFYSANRAIPSVEAAPKLINIVPTILINSSQPFELSYLESAPNLALSSIEDHPRAVNYVYDEIYSSVLLYPSTSIYLEINRPATCSSPRWLVQGSIYYVAVDGPTNALLTISPNLNINAYKNAPLTLEVNLG